MDQATYRKLKSLLEPKETPEELDRFIAEQWNIRLPWDVVDEDSTSSPLAFVWGVYYTFLTGEGPTRHVLAASRNGAKCLKEGTLVATPKGPVEIQNLKPGDKVYDEHGKQVNVLKVWDQGVQECVDLVNNRTVWATCTANHRFLGYDQRKPDIKKEIKPENLYGDLKICRVELKQGLGDKNVPEAYALGAMLGDGCKGSGSMEISSNSPEIPEKLAKALNTSCKKSISNNFTWRVLTPDGFKKGVRWIWSEYYEKWCRNKYAHEKIIDLNEIKTWNRDSLLNLFAGILDTDGSVNVSKKHNTGQINLEIGMQAKSVIDAVKWMFMALWQVDVKVKESSRSHYKNGSVYRVRLSHNHHNKRILKELTPYLALDRKKYKPEYDNFKVNNFNPGGMGFKVVPAGKHKCYDITVDSPTSLFCLQNGLVTHNTLTSSMLQYFSLVHFRRDGAHIASTLAQSSQATRYLDNFLNIPEFSQYIETDNTKVKEFKNLPANDFTNKPNVKLQVITATKKGANAPRASCLEGKTKVLVKRTDGTSDASGSTYKNLTMRGIYDRFNKGQEIILPSVDAETGQISNKRVVAVKKDINLDRVAITTKSGKVLHSTPDHWHSAGYKNGKIWYTKAKDFKVGDPVLRKNFSINHKTDVEKLNKRLPVHPYKEHKFNGNLFTVEDIIEGSLLGDGCVYLRRLKSDGSGEVYKGNAYFMINKTPKVRDYLTWISGKLSGKYLRTEVRDDLRKSGYTGKYLSSISCRAHPDFTKYYRKWYPNRKKIVPKDLKLTWGKFAIWLMDDGNKELRRISSHGFSLEDQKILCEKINKLVGFDCAKIGKENKKDGRSYNVIDLSWPYEQYDRLFRLKDYFHPSYLYKFNRNPKECKQCGDLYYFPLNTNLCNNEECHFKEYANGVFYDEIVKIEKYKENPKARNRWVYDIKVEDNHNFFANQILTHNCLTLDEVDLTPREILSEVAFVADPSIQYLTEPNENGTVEDPLSWYLPTGETKKHDTIFVYLSSRKTNDGPIQDLIDESKEPNAQEVHGIKLHKWSSADWMEKCPDEVHKPEKGRFEAYLHTETLEVKWGKKEFEAAVPPAARSQYKDLSVYEGCKTCPAFIACQGRSARQRGSSPMLRTRKFTGDVLKAVKSAAAIIAQALNWKPETTGLVFRTFSHRKHVRDPIDFYEWVTFGDKFNPRNIPEDELLEMEESGDVLKILEITPTKEDIYYAMVREGWIISSGVDWGFRPDPAFCIIVGWHKKTKRLAVLHMESEHDHANHVWANYVAERVYPRFPFEFVGPDLADPASPGYFRKHKIRSLDKKPSRIETGVSFIRGLLWDPVEATSNFCILDDSQGEDKNKLLIDAMSHWTHAKDALGRWNMKKFADDEWTHALDSIRYATAPYVNETNISVNVGQKPVKGSFQEYQDKKTEDSQIFKQKQDMTKAFEDHLQTAFGVSKPFKKHEELSKTPQELQKDEQKKKVRSGIKFKI